MYSVFLTFIMFLKTFMFQIDARTFMHNKNNQNDLLSLLDNPIQLRITVPWANIEVQYPEWSSSSLIINWVLLCA